MNLERQALKGRQAERKQQLLELAVEIKGLARSIRSLLPMDVPVEDMNVSEAKALMDRMADLDLERRHIKTEYDEAEKELV